MVNVRLFLNFALIITLAFGLGAFTTSANAEPITPPVITIIEPSASYQSPSYHMDLGTSRVQTVNLQAAILDLIAGALSNQSGSVYQAEFQVFDDLGFIATFTGKEDTLQGGYLLHGFLDNATNNTITVSSTNGVISAILTNDGVQYQLKKNQYNLYQFEEVNQDLFPSEANSIQLPEALLEPTAPNNETLPEMDTGALIDVMVVYTDDARSAAGGTTNMANLINLAVSETNTGYSLSGIVQRMRLVHTAEVSFNESNFNWETVLNQLTNTDGVIDEVKTWRNTYAADVVVMIVNNAIYCGIGWLMNPSYTYDSVGFSLVSRTCATGYYSFAHETGHNMGAHHDRANASGSAMYSYSYGYQAPDSSFRTIMAYNCSTGCTRINRWSNPEISYNGIPTGVIYTASNSADNRRTLNNTASIIANFRQSTTIPIAPSNLRVTAVTPTSLSLSFSDNSADETGFRMERSISAGAWSLVATLSANQTTFMDENLTCSTNYAYRVKAYNSSGESATSNTINTATALCTPPAVPDAITTISTINSVVMNWNDVADESAYIIEQSLDQAATWTQLITLPQNSTTYQIVGLDRNTTYLFRLAIQNSYGIVYSNPITITTMSQAIYLPTITR